AEVRTVVFRLRSACATNFRLKAELQTLHLLLRGDRDAKELGSLVEEDRGLRLVYNSVLVLSGVRRLLTRTLIRSDAYLLVLLGSCVVKGKLRSDVPADRLAIFKQRNAVRRRRIEPIVRLPEHHRH